MGRDAACHDGCRSSNRRLEGGEASPHVAGEVSSRRSHLGEGAAASHGEGEARVDTQHEGRDGGASVGGFRCQMRGGALGVVVLAEDSRRHRRVGGGVASAVDCPSPSQGGALARDRIFGGGEVRHLHPNRHRSACDQHMVGVDIWAAQRRRRRHRRAHSACREKRACWRGWI